MFKLFLTFILLFSTTAQARVTVHAVGPQSELKRNLSGCEIAKDSATYFETGKQFLTLYAFNSQGKCNRVKGLKKSCKPKLYYCNTQFYKYKSLPVIVFDPTYPHPTFAGKIFAANQTKSQACGTTKHENTIKSRQQKGLKLHL